VIKAARSAIASAAAVRHHEGAVVAKNIDQALAAAAALQRDGLVPIAQEFVHRREKINLSIMRRGGRSEMRFTYRVLRDVPLSGGIAMAAETISPVDGVGAAAVAALERVCDAAGYDGLANGEFCRAPDGRLHLIEVNPRLWGSSWFAERLGQRVAERGVRLALGLPSLPEVPYPVGRRFHHVAGELAWLRLHGARLEPVLELARTTRPTDVFDGLALADPVPAVKSFVRRLRGQTGFS
jgi:predicted ATP-grasp superfamily ATP-dependent carboligase